MISILDNATANLTREIYQPARAETDAELACLLGDAATVVHLFDSQRLTDKSNLFNALLYAVRDANESTVSALLSRGVTPTLVHFTEALQGKDYQIMQMFLDKDLNVNEPMGTTQPPPLWKAFDDRALTKWLLEHGADPNARCNYDKTPLSIAVSSASFDIIELLFQHGGSADCGQLLFHAVRRESDDYLKVFDYILRRKSSKDVNGLMFEDHPFSFGFYSCFLVDTLLHQAAEASRPDLVERLLYYGAVQRKDSKGRFPISVAGGPNQAAIVDMLKSK